MWFYYFWYSTHVIGIVHACTVISALDIDEVDGPDTFRYADHCLSCRGTLLPEHDSILFSHLYNLLLSLLWLMAIGVCHCMEWYIFFLAFNIFGNTTFWIIIVFTLENFLRCVGFTITICFFSLLLYDIPVFYMFFLKIICLPVHLSELVNNILRHIWCIKILFNYD